MSEKISDQISAIKILAHQGEASAHEIVHRLAYACERLAVCVERMTERRRAERLGRRSIGIEINPTYVAQARERLRAEEKGHRLRDERAGQGVLFDGGSKGS